MGAGDQAAGVPPSSASAEASSVPLADGALIAPMRTDLSLNVMVSCCFLGYEVNDVFQFFELCLCQLVFME
eukprot:IDg23662t1